ncbi:hypothetical protein quinque_006753 [Culex quinquefasciatus]
MRTLLSSTLLQIALLQLSSGYNYATRQCYVQKQPSQWYPRPVAIHVGHECYPFKPDDGTSDEPIFPDQEDQCCSCQMKGPTTPRMKTTRKRKPTTLRPQTAKPTEQRPGESLNGTTSKPQSTEYPGQSTKSSAELQPTEYPGKTTEGLAEQQQVSTEYPGQATGVSEAQQSTEYPGQPTKASEVQQPTEYLGQPTKSPEDSQSTEYPGQPTESSGREQSTEYPGQSNKESVVPLSTEYPGQVTQGSADQQSTEYPGQLTGSPDEQKSPGELQSTEYPGQPTESSDQQQSTEYPGQPTENITEQQSTEYPGQPTQSSAELQSTQYPGQDTKSPDEQQPTEYPGQPTEQPKQPGSTSSLEDKIKDLIKDIDENHCPNQTLVAGEDDNKHTIAKAGPLVLEGFRNASKAVDTKRTHFDVVTEYDRQVEQLLIGGLLGRYPDHRILAEESSTEAAAKEPLDGRPTWIIDPIDGTLNFVRGIPFVAISVALVVDGELTIGIISNPCMDEIYTAIRGQGAFLNGVAIRTKGIQDLKSAMVHMGIGRKSLAHGANFVRECSGLRIFGSAALTLAYIAAGSVDLYCVEWLKPWDIAAGALLVREAGGVVRGFGGGAYDIMKPDILAASSAELAERALEVMGESSG